MLARFNHASPLFVNSFTPNRLIFQLLNGDKNGITYLPPLFEGKGKT
jgi:hypothetical protein